MLVLSCMAAWGLSVWEVAELARFRRRRAGGTDGAVSSAGSSVVVVGALFALNGCRAISDEEAEAGAEF